MQRSAPTPEFTRFLKVATDCRAAQKRYFQNRKTPEAGQYLAESIALERQLDALILEFNQAEQLQQPLFNPLNSKPMFFQNLAQHAPNLDVQIRIMAKDGKLTVSVLPMTTEKFKAITVTATPEELDADFIEAIIQPVTSAVTIKDQVAGQLTDHPAPAETKADVPAPPAEAEKPVKKSRSKKTRFAKAPEEEVQEELAEEVQPEMEAPTETEQNSGIVNGEPWPPAPDESGTEKTDSPAVETETPATDEPSEKPNWEVVHTDVEPNVEPETPATGALIIPLVEAASEAKETSETEEPKKAAFPEIIAAESEQMAASKPTPPRPTPALF